METGLQIVPFSVNLASRFRDLNMAWLQKYFYVEPLDEEVLSHPEEYIIARGGQIYFALQDGVVAGTFAFIKISEGVYELSKMAVDEAFQGKGIGNALLAFAVEKGVENNWEKIILFSNTILHPAIHLYKKYGFVEVPVLHSEYKRANIKMEKVLV